MAAVLIPVIASAAGAALTASATNKAAKGVKAAADANTALQREALDDAQRRLGPYADQGTAANDRIGAFLGLGGDEAAAKAAFQDFLESTGFRFQVDEGTKAITARKATQGLLNSGSTLKALDQYGQNLARGSANQYLGQLGDVANRGAQAASGVAAAGGRFADTASQNNNNAAQASGQASIAQANGLNGLLGSALNAFGQVAGQSSYAAPKFKF